MQLDEDAARLGQRSLDAADIGDLAAEMEVDQLQAIGHVALLEVVEGLEHLGQGQAELGAIAGAGTPTTRTARRQLDADAEHRPYPQLLRVADDRLQFGELLDDRDDVLPNL